MGNMKNIVNKYNARILNKDNEQQRKLLQLPKQRILPTT